MQHVGIHAMFTRRGGNRCAGLAARSDQFSLELCAVGPARAGDRVVRMGDLFRHGVHDGLRGHDGACNSSFEVDGLAGRIRLPSVGTLFMPKLATFKRLYPDIELDFDYSDRLVDVIEEGFDAVIRTGEPSDSRLMSRRLGSCRRVIVGAPSYFSQAGVPHEPADLTRHGCLLYRFPSTGKLDTWPVTRTTDMPAIELPISMVTNTLDPQVCFAEQGLGIACLPEIAVRQQLQDGKLITVLDEYNHESMVFHVLWPSSRHLSPKIRAFVDFVAENLFPF
ncbi:TPA: hypothetical protein L4W55_002574 [Pseudomonas aeruginosa]|nr:hypothetical protein [Pseudomonas aeruginosa]